MRVDDIESQDQTLYAPAGPVYLGRISDQRGPESILLYRVGDDDTLYDFLDAIEQANARLVVRASAERNQATLDNYFTTADTRAPVWVAKDADGVVVVPRAHAAEVIALAEAHNAKEQKAQAAIDAGTYDRAWVLESLRAKGCEGA